MVSLSDSVLRPKISVCSFIKTRPLIDRLNRALAGDHYSTVSFETLETFFHAVEDDFPSIDCLILEQSQDFPVAVNHLHHSAILLPAVILTGRDIAQNELPQGKEESVNVYYHTAEAYLDIDDFTSISHTIESAIAKFLRLSPQCRLPTLGPFNEEDLDLSAPSLQETLSVQQRRLSEKIKERLGYLGIFYKRDAYLFFRNLSKPDQLEFMNELKSDYRDIILVYFQEKSDVNQKIDAFVNKVFFSDLSVSQVLEIHMEFMDKLAKKLKIEGRSEDILLDYRLTLIDTVAHLCEMYRRSIPRKP
jgi:circadian clock protein KaiA